MFFYIQNWPNFPSFNIDRIPSSRKIYTNNKKSVKVGFWRTLVSFQGDPPTPQLAATPPRPSIPFGRSATCLQTPGQSLSRLGTVQAHFYAFPALLHPELAVLQQLVDLEGHLLERVLHIHAKLAGSLHEEEIVVVGELLGLFCGHLLNCELKNEDLFFYAIQLKRGKILPHFTCDGWMIFQLEVRSSFSRAFKCTKSRTLFYIRDYRHQKTNLRFSSNGAAFTTAATGTLGVKNTCAWAKIPQTGHKKNPCAAGA